MNTLNESLMEAAGLMGATLAPVMADDPRTGRLGLLVVTFPQRLGREEAAQVREQLAGVLQGTPLEGTKIVVLEGGTAIIPIYERGVTADPSLAQLDWDDLQRRRSRSQQLSTLDPQPSTIQP